MATGVKKKSRGGAKAKASKRRKAAAKRPKAAVKGAAKGVAKSPAKKMPSASVGSGLYLFGISKKVNSAQAQKALIGVIGIDGLHPVEAMDCEGLSCWVTRVQTDEFADEMNRNAENLDWLAEAGLRHQRAVGAIAGIDGIALLPTRFGVLFSSPGALIKNVRERKESLADAFDRVQGCEEWGVKVFVTPRARAPRVEAASGKDYLKRKAEALAASGPGAPDEEIEQFAKELQAVTRASAFSNRMSGAQPGLQWQASYLVPLSSRKKWDAVMKKYAEQWADGRRIECTGPWPPYSFVAPQTEGDNEGDGGK